MRIVLASATRNEISSTIQWLGNAHNTFPQHDVSILITGIGGTAASYALTKKLKMVKPHLVIQAGIAGCFSGELSLGNVVFVKEEIFADLGAMEEGTLTDIFDLGLTATNEKPYSKKMLVNPNLKEWEKYRLPFTRGATINCISSTPEQVSMITEKYQPAIESMEGAALHYVCLMENIPFIQIRSVSNFAGERNKANWKMMEAIKNLNDQLKNILEDQLINGTGSSEMNKSL